MDRVLIIDDDRELCALVQRTLVAAGVDADCCHSGQSGLLHMEGRDYQLVILDVMMPGFDGFDTLEKIRARSCVPVLMLTAKGDGASKVRGLRAGADDYLPKPFDLEELSARVLALIRRYTCLNRGLGVASRRFASRASPSTPTRVSSRRRAAPSSFPRRNSTCCCFLQETREGS